MLFRSITAKIYETRLGPIVLKNINKQLSSEIVVSDVKFSILKKFPNASFELKDVYVKPNSDFIEIGRASCRERV